jgi:hypothetical protein
MRFSTVAVAAEICSWQSAVAAVIHNVDRGLAIGNMHGPWLNTTGPVHGHGSTRATSSTPLFWTLPYPHPSASGVSLPATTTVASLTTSVSLKIVTSSENRTTASVSLHTPTRNATAPTSSLSVPSSFHAGPVLPNQTVGLIVIVSLVGGGFAFAALFILVQHSRHQIFEKAMIARASVQPPRVLPPQGEASRRTAMTLDGESPYSGSGPAGRPTTTQGTLYSDSISEDSSDVASDEVIEMRHSHHSATTTDNVQVAWGTVRGVGLVTDSTTFCQCTGDMEPESHSDFVLPDITGVSTSRRTDGRRDWIQFLIEGFW